MLNTAQNLGAAVNHALYSSFSFVYPSDDGAIELPEQMIAVHVYPLELGETVQPEGGSRRRIAPLVQKNRRVHARRRSCIVLPEGFWL